MLLPWSVTGKAPSYKSYKNRVFNKYLAKAKAIKQGVKDNSLKEEDKEKLIKKMIKILKS